MRVAVFVTGVVQGVGFRPFVYALARELGLGGFVRNEGGSVHLELEGPSVVVSAGCERLEHDAPALARVETIRREARAVLGEEQFRIEASSSGDGRELGVSADIATCAECLREVFDPRDRRYRYPFTNCAQCGPRLTIVTGAPYDRERTTMASFDMCRRCRVEYEATDNRRFHAQPIACPDCGPTLALRDRSGRILDTDDVIRETMRRLLSGEIAALKGLGGYHLACDATSEDAVSELRRRKHRDQKPLALMVADEAGARRLCDVSDAELALLQSPARPIVLLTRRNDASIADVVAPGLCWLGLMLPYTALHHLLFAERRAVALVMTSGNASDEPIAYTDEDALERLLGIADFFVTHDRKIHVRCDDSVVRYVAGATLPIRRSRGYVPCSISLPMSVPEPALALGGELKNAIALADDKRAFLSGHVGDLDDFRAYESYVEVIEHYCRLFEIEPSWVVHDLHPDYASTRHAFEWERRGVRRLSVQHHHAHMAACMAEHGLTDESIGVIFDGMGLGLDGSAWGGEFLVGNAAAFERAAHLLPVALPGGDRAAREPWRMAVAHLLAAGRDPRTLPLAERIEPRTLELVVQMIQRGINSPKTTSVGRLFDAVASLAGVADRIAFEAQAAMQLESLAARELHRADDVVRDAYPFAVREGATSLIVDTAPLILAVAEDARERIPWRFHATLAEIVATVCVKLARAHATDRVVLSGGVFQNGVLTSLTTRRLEALGLRVYTHRLVPPNDACLSLGQLAILAACVSKPD